MKNEKTFQYLDISTETDKERAQLIEFLREFGAYLGLTTAQRALQGEVCILRIKTTDANKLWKFIQANFLSAEDWGAIQYANLEEAESAPDFIPEKFSPNIKLNT